MMINKTKYIINIVNVLLFHEIIIFRYQIYRIKNKVSMC